jgi:hypothetical protein
MRNNKCYKFPLPDLRFLSIRLNASGQSWALFLGHDQLEDGFETPQDAASAARNRKLSSILAIHALGNAVVSDVLEEDWDYCTVAEINQCLEQAHRIKSSLVGAATPPHNGSDETAFAS